MRIILLTSYPPFGVTSVLDELESRAKRWRQLASTTVRP